MSRHCCSSRQQSILFLLFDADHYFRRGYMRQSTCVFCCTGIGGRPGVGRVYSCHHNLSDRSDTSWRCLDLIRQLLLAIRAYAKPYNNRYYVHRDLKPSNMMVKIEWENGMPFQQLKIIDFDMLVAQNLSGKIMCTWAEPLVMCIRSLSP